MSKDPIHAFYCTKAWLDLAQAAKIKSNGECNKCHNFFDVKDLRPHHITKLTIENIDDPNITLNQDNIEVICHDCHNEVHKRFGGTIIHRVFIVHGAPFSGKKTYVKQVATRKDLIVDLDKLHNAISIIGKSLINKPDESTKKLAFEMRDLLIDRIRLRSGKWEDAYIIGAYPQLYEREHLAKELGAELIHIDTRKEDCLKRVQITVEHLPSQQMYMGFVEDYFRRFTN